MKTIWSVLILAAAAVACGAEIEGPTEVDEHRLVRLELTGVDGSAVWEAIGIEQGRFTEADGGELNNGLKYWFTGPPGEYRVTATYLTDGTLGKVRTYVTIGDEPEPKPDPDVDPKPPVPPDPPVPPQPDVEPIIPGEGMRVMILYETSDTLPAEQQAILTSVKLADYLNDATTRDGRVPGYRRWTDDFRDEQLEHESDLWKTAYANVKDAAEELPWIVATNGDKQVSAPLPATVDETIALLKTVE